MVEWGASTSESGSADATPLPAQKIPTTQQSNLTSRCRMSMIATENRWAQVGIAPIPTGR